MNDNKTGLPVLSVSGLYKWYDDRLILNGVEFSAYEKEFICILGRSGCGKSTFLRTIAGLEAFQGDITADGKRVTGPGSDRIMVFQDFEQLLPWKTIEQNVQYPVKINKGIRDRKLLKEISDRYLDMVELKRYAQYYPHQLSGGMKQRVAIARALAIEPDIILMDEPFASLDAMTRRSLQNELLNIFNHQKLTVLFVTHNIQEALILSSRIIVMSKEGSISCDMENKLSKPVTPDMEGYGELWGTLAHAIGIETAN